MTDNELQALRAADKDGMLTYEYIANNVGECDDNLPALVDILSDADTSGQFTASAARFLHAIDAEAYAGAVNRLVETTIGHDRERRYLPELMEALHGKDYAEHAAELSAADNNFRRMYKRLYTDGDPM